MEREKDEIVKRINADRSKSRPTIGFLVYGAEDPNSNPIWEGVYEASKARGVNLLCFPGKPLHSNRGFDAQANVLYELISKENVDGFVSWGARLASNVGVEEIKAFYKYYHPLPIINVGMLLQDIPSVFVDNYKGMYDLMVHLIECHGYRRIAFINGPRDNPEAQERYRAYKEALTEKNIPFDENFIAPGDFGKNAGRDAIQLFKNLNVNFEAIVAANDMMALGAMEVLQMQGVRVPNDVAVVGFDDVNQSRYSIPPLTTVRQLFYEYGKKATEMLLALLAGEKVPEQVILPTELVLRESCGCLNPAVLHAKAGITTKAGAIPRTAFAASREKILSEVVKKVADSSIDNVTESVKQLWNAIYTELKEESSGNCLSILDETLRQEALAGGDVLIWHEAVSIMRHSILLNINDDRILFRIEDFWQQARVLIGERAQQAQGYRKSQADQRTAILNEINHALVTTSNERELMDILARGLSRLNIPSCYVSLYENPVVPTEWCTPILIYRDGHVEQETGEQHFSSRQLVPDDLLPHDRSYSLVVEPLYFRENQIGIAVFEVVPREEIVYETLRGQLSSALWAARLGKYLSSLYEASNNIRLLQEPRDILQEVVERARQVVGAKVASVVILDKDGRLRRLATGGNLSSSKYSTILVGTASMVSQVMHSNEPILIENLHKQAGSASQGLIELEVEAAGCFPLRLGDKPIGAMWVFYEKQHHFSGAEVNALRLYVNQAAIMYDNARRTKELIHLRQAAEKLANVADVQEVLQQIVISAREVLEADSAVIWSYDAARETFLPAELAVDGVTPDVLEKFKGDNPRADGTAAIVIQNGYLAVTDVEDPKYDYLRVPARRLRHAIGVKSFQGITLQVQGETLGVLYVNHQQPRGFDEEDESTLRTFAYDAALALKKARLLERLRKGHEAARIVAEASVLENLQVTLKAIAKGTKDALGCDAVSLYTYDEGNDEIGFPPAMVGVENTGAVLKFGMVEKDSLIRKVLTQDGLYVAKDAPSDPIVGGPFVKREGIKSSVSMPLKVGNSKVGVMFVNYRTPYHFTKEELADIELFAHQAAVAIRDAQLYDDTKEGAAYLQTFYEAGNIVTSTLSLDAILNHIVEQASRLTSATGGNQSHYSYLALMEDGKLKFKAMYSSFHPLEPIKQPYEIDFQNSEKIGIVGRAFQSGESQLVRDVTVDPDYRQDDDNTRSLLAVPIKVGEDIVGVIEVEHPEFAAFDRNDLAALEALAKQAAIAIRNARQYEELKRIQGLVGSRTALAWMGMASNTWRHTIDKHAQTIKEQVDLLFKDLIELILPDKNPRPYERMSMIQRLAQQIKEKEITPPLSTEEGVISVHVNQLIRERVKQLWENEPYKSIVYQPKLSLDDRRTVRASPQWFRRALDYLIDNAVNSMTESPRREITIETCEEMNHILIRIRDTGKGIPEDILKLLFSAQIKKPKESKGLGMGLLMVQAIIQTFGGEIRVETTKTTSPTGTTMLIQFQLET
jgi:DNA-binding LacI/PurR family transcriptional regulator/GAF domain-containing protein